MSFPVQQKEQRAKSNFIYALGVDFVVQIWVLAQTLFHTLHEE